MATTSQDLPRFSVPQGRGYSLSMKPPFSFTGVTSLVFPLRASLDALQRFCDNYLNIIPPELGRFRAPLPYVYLVLLDYGRMAIDVANVGWLSQREVLFSIPLEWYRVKNGRWEFYDWASICPFIYVDDDMSMAVGRGVYGWPKTTATMDKTLSDWMVDPLGPIAEATLSTAVFPELYAGSKLEERVFLQVERQRAPSTARIPFDLANGFAPWTIASNVADAMSGWGRDAVGAMAGLGFLPMHPGSTGDNYLTMMSKMVEAGFPLRPNMAVNTINLKQFRRSEEPGCFAYQALTNGPMRYTAFNRGGALGQERVLLGDVTGGYSIRLHRWPSLPIIDTLGLEVAQQWKGAEHDIALLKPVLPFWYDVNMTYVPGYNVAWRSRDGLWHDDTGRAYPRAPHESMELQRLFNTTLGAGNKAVAGPFHFSHTTIRVLPLLAERATLEKFVDEYLNEPLREGHAGARFALWSGGDASEFAYVYVTATSFGDVTSGTDNVGDWANVELSFLVPVKWKRGDADMDPDGWNTTGVGLVPAFTYLDSVTAVTARDEVLGIPCTVASFGNPESAWMAGDEEHPTESQTLLTVQAEILPVVGEGQPSRRGTIVDVVEGYPAEYEDPHQWRETADRWGAVLKSELQRKRTVSATKSDEMVAARAMALELLGNRTPFSLFTLKQFRDVADADKACYQSIVRIHRTFNEVLDIREIEHPLTIHVHEFPTQPLVGLLGLVCKEVEGDGDGITYAMQPVRPFWMHVTMDEDLGEMLLYRSGPGEWREPVEDAASRRTPHLAENPRSYFDAGCAPAVGMKAADMLDIEDPRRLAKAAIDWRTNKTSSYLRRKQLHEPRPGPARACVAQQLDSADNLTAQEASAAIAAIDPQMVIESILSREWGNWSDDARWLVYRESLARKLDDQTSGMPGDLQGETDIKFLINEPLTRGSPFKPVDDSEERVNHLLEDIAGIRKKIESAWMAVFLLAKEDVEFRESKGAKPQPRYGDVPSAITRLLDALAEMDRYYDQPDASGNLRRETPASAAEAVGAAEKTGADGLVAAAQLNAENRTRFHEIVTRLEQEVGPLARVRVASDESAKAKAAFQHGLVQLAAITWANGDAFREAVSLARSSYLVRRDTLLNIIARDAQKPDFVVRRDAAGPEEDRVFPIEDSWDRKWYTGTPARSSL